VAVTDDPFTREFATRQRQASLPTPLTSLVGREADLGYLESALQLEDARALRLLSLLGAPATGKTRLAIAAAEQVQGNFEHGVCFVDLSTVRDAAAVPAAIAHELGATYRGQRAVSLEDTLKRALRDRHARLWCWTTSKG
jgi:hypothetical protein